MPGLGIAGDAFDAKIVRNLVSPALGAGTQLRSMDKILPVPIWVYAKLERWHHLSLLKAKDVMDMLGSVRGQALQPGEDRGADSSDSGGSWVSVAPGRAESEVRSFGTGSRPLSVFRWRGELDAVVQRCEFEGWIAEELGQIEKCVDSLLRSSGVERGAVDMVFLTGGSSFVPAVRRIFESRFGAGRIRAGNEFTSVARGLALKSAAAGVG